jgi:hypothetical protein
MYGALVALSEPHDMQEFCEGQEESMDEKTEIHDVSVIKARLLAKMGDFAGDFPVQIERRFPRILAKIDELWGTAELDAYLDVLMLSDREDRQGFPPEVAMEVFRLITVHAALGLAPKSTGTGWAGIEEAVLEKKAFVKDVT